MASVKYWLWLTGREGIGHQGAFRLLEHFGTPENVYYADREEYRLFGFSGRAAASLEDKSLHRADWILGECERLGLRVLTMQDADYPERLRQIADPPCVLYVKGRLPAVDEELAVAVVGTRSPTAYGIRMAGKLGLDLARRGALVVSGIAQGLDSAALRGALSGGGQVLSVLGNGIDVIYPAQNRALYEDVAAAGALISEYPPGTPVDGRNFPIRNRIISGLSLGVVAVEAAERSGTLITARLALEQNREVFAFPGSADAAMSRGTNLLIQRGEAKLILSAEDVLEEFSLLYPHRLRPAEPMTEGQVRERLDWLLPAPEKGKPPVDKKTEVDKEETRAYITLKETQSGLTDDEREILLALEERELDPDDLVEKTQIPTRRVLSALTMLQLQGYVEEKKGRRFSARAHLERE